MTEPEIYRHKKRGTEYRILGVATIHGSNISNHFRDEMGLYIYTRDDGSLNACAPWEFHSLETLRIVKNNKEITLQPATLQLGDTTSLTDGSKVIVYYGDDNKFWVREYNEFHDGRFEKVLPENHLDKISLMTKICDRLEEVYNDDPIMISGILDSRIDRSGNLLGWLREFRRNYND
jgi:hypothetical protein